MINKFLDKFDFGWFVIGLGMVESPTGICKSLYFILFVGVILFISPIITPFVVQYA